MPPRVQRLHVVEHEIDPWEKPLEHLPFNAARCLDGSVEPRCLAGIQQPQEKLRLRGGLPAGECHPAAGLLVEGTVALQHGHHLCHAHRRRIENERRGRAGLDACPAAGALRAVDHNAPVCSGGKSAVGAGPDALPAVDALLCAVDEVFRPAPGVRAAAPQAAQRAALEEHDAADARPVMDHVALDARHFSCRGRGFAAGGFAHA